MKIKLTLGLLAMFLIGNDNNLHGFAQMIENKVKVDTIVGSEKITDEIAGSAYRKRAIGYFVIIDKDTSDYTCIFTESKDGGRIGIHLNIPYLKATMTYRERMEELKIILPKAATDFSFDSLTSMYFGRLILSGDLAVDVTKQYRQKFGESDDFENYTTVGQFLKTSKLGTDINNLFNQYSISVDEVSFEKLFFTTSKDLYWASKIESATTIVPDKILDCMIWVKLTKK